MKIIPQNFKQEINKFGRQLDSKITFERDGEQIELGGSELNSITPQFESSILKSAMKQLNIDSNMEIPLKTVLNYKLGVFIDGEYKYIDYGNYIVKSVEKSEDTNSYNIVCYDKMLNSMQDYIQLNHGEYPMTIRDYINNICLDLGIEFANNEDEFANYNMILENDLYAGLDYTYRDVLDELAGVTASTICINKDDKLEIRYINETNDEIDENFLKQDNVKFGEKYGPINSIVLSRAGGSDNVFLRDEQSVVDNGLCEVKIIDNQIMNFNDREQYLPAILEKINGLYYYQNDFQSTGICYYDICDAYNVRIGENVYRCIMFNDQTTISQGIEEYVYTDLPEGGETDYSKADKTDRRINQAYIIVDKQNQTIEAVVSKTENIEQTENNNYQDLLNKFQSIDLNIAKIEGIEHSVKQLQTDTYTKTEVNQIANGIGVDGQRVTAVITESATFDENGMTYEKTNAKSKTTINETGVNVKDSSNKSLLFAGYVNENNEDYQEYKNQTIVGTENIVVKNYLNIGNHSRIQDYEDGTGMFYMSGGGF